MVDPKDIKKGKDITLMSTSKVKTKTSDPVLKVTVTEDKSVKFDRVYNINASSGDIVDSSTAITATPITKEEYTQLVESVDYAKSSKPYWSRLKVGLSLKDGLYFELDRSPSKVTKTKAQKKKK